jgi:hypothetical protein
LKEFRSDSSLRQSEGEEILRNILISSANNKTLVKERKIFTEFIKRMKRSELR